MERVYVQTFIFYFFNKIEINVYRPRVLGVLLMKLSFTKPEFLLQSENALSNNVYFTNQTTGNHHGKAWSLNTILEMLASRSDLSISLSVNFCSFPIYQQSNFYETDLLIRQDIYIYTRMCICLFVQVCVCLCPIRMNCLRKHGNHKRQMTKQMVIKLILPKL